MSKDTRSLGEKMAHGAGWMIFARMGVNAIGFVSTIILARLLMPEDFGLIALTMSIVAGLQAMSEFSFNIFLITKQDSDRRHYDTIWTLAILRGVLLSAILLMAAPSIDGFFDDPRLIPITQWIAVSILISGLENPGVVNFQKDLRFSRDFVWMIGTKIVSFVVTIVMAFVLRNYWALVIGIIAMSCTRVILSFTMHPYRPRLSLAKVADVMGFSAWLLANNLVNYFRGRGDQLVLGRFLGVGSVGYYSVAFQIVDLIGAEVLGAIRRALLPGYSKVAIERRALAEMFMDNSALIALLMTPLAIGLGLTAEPLVRVVLGEKWLEAVPLLQVLSAYAFFNIWSTAGSPVLLALKRASTLTVISLISAVILIALMILAAIGYGAPGVAAAVSVTAGLWTVILWGVLLRLLPMSLGEMVRRIWRVLLALLVMSVAVLLVQERLPAIDSLSSGLISLVLHVGTGAAAYVLTIVVAWMAAGRPAGPEKAALAFMVGKFRTKGTRPGTSPVGNG